MNRRTFLAVAGGTTATSLAGCLGGGGGGQESTAETDGYPDPSVVDTPSEDRDVDPSGFDTLDVEGIEVPLVPVDVAHYWYRQREARFADARGAGQYEESHVVGAVLSPASGSDDDPATEWPTDSRIVTYCGCPHHLSSIRAARFLDDGYESVYAIDEGFFEWRDRGYPVTGDDAARASYVVRGQTDPAAAGEYAWATHEPTDQQEAGPIDDDGGYRLELHFSDVGDASPVHLQTPTYELTAPLSELTADVVTGAE